MAQPGDTARPEDPAQPGDAAGAAPAVHPPRLVLELAELVLDGVLTRLPAGLVHPPDGAAAVILQDAEGTPVARVGVDGSVVGLQPFGHPPLRSHRLTPAQVRDRRPAAARLGVPVAGTLTADQVGHVVRVAGDAGAGILWLALVGDGWADPGRGGSLTPHALFRAVERLAAAVGGLAVPVALPVDHRGLIGEVGRGYGADRVIDAYVERPAGPRAQPHPAFAAEAARQARRPPERGVVVFLTGLSGSGKSTIAKGLHERLLDDGTRTVTMLDGDEVRRLLSAGLGFSRTDRDLNIRRIGFVAAEVARHGGLAICAPIAPFAAGRAEVRAMVEAAGGDVVLVHVATPLAECERRDRKGLYAQARRGEIAEFTGISSPYEPPGDADLVLDTNGVPVDTCVQAVWDLLTSAGHLPR